eukprot:gene22772-25334_t
MPHKNITQRPWGDWLKRRLARMGNESVQQNGGATTATSAAITAGFAAASAAGVMQTSPQRDGISGPVATMKHGSTLVSETAQFTALVYLDSRWVVAATSSGTLLVYDTAPGHWQHTCVGTLEGK